MPDPMSDRSCLSGGIRPARIEEAAVLSDLCARSKALWGYDEAFMALAREALQVGVKEIAAGNVWVATTANGSIAGVVALAPGEQSDRLDLDKLFVEPRHIRGGFGRALLDHATREARRRGATRLMILAIRMPPRFTSAAARTGSGRRRPTRSRGAWCHFTR